MQVKHLKTVHLTYPLNLEEIDFPETVAAIGFFDGIHMGHQQVIKTAVLEARRRQLKSAVMTFYPHPSVVLNKDVKHVQYITPLPEKEAVLKDLYVDYLYIITFNQELSRLLPEEFIDHFIVGLNVKHLVAGFDYTYGHKGQGNMGNIETYAKGRFTHSTIDKLDLINEKVSSTRIRHYLHEGQIENVNLLLGRPFRLSGIVRQGDQRGRTIGFPTANIDVGDDILLPKLGVYGVHIYVDQRKYDGMANIGVKPTFKDDQPKPSVEVNIFDFNQDIYGKEVQVELIHFIRPEQKFANVEALIQQIKQDEIKIRQLMT